MADGNRITNGIYTVSAEKGVAGVQVLLRGKPVFGAAQAGDARRCDRRGI
jgi:hypothetical protein